jgi:hypothetical protein
MMRPLTTIRGQTTIVQTNNQVPALHPVSGATIISGGAQVRLATPSNSKVEPFVLLLTSFIAPMELKLSILHANNIFPSGGFLFLLLFFMMTRRNGSSMC